MQVFPVAMGYNPFEKNSEWEPLTDAEFNYLLNVVSNVFDVFKIDYNSFTEYYYVKNGRRYLFLVR